MAQALADLFALVGEPEVQQAGNQQPVQQAVADGAIVLAELEDLQQIATADADRAQARKYNRRSWELMKHARDRREVHIRTRKTDAETAKRRRAEQKLQLVAASQPGSSSVLGIRQQSSTPQQLAAIHVSIACKLRIRGKASEHFAKRQDRSLSLVAQCCSVEQAKFISDMVAPLPRDVGSFGKLVQRIFGCALQFDETSQKLMPLATGQLPKGIRSTRAQLSSQVMVLSGKMIVGEAFESTPFGLQAGFNIQEHPWHTRSLRLANTDSNHLIEGLLRALPLGMSRDSLSDALCRNDVVVIVATLDRAAANILLSKWFCHFFWNDLKLGPRITFHNEPCALHGCALVKLRCPTSKQVAAALYSFTRWLRIGKNFAALTDAIYMLVDEKLEVRDAPRPKEECNRAKAFIEVLYGNDLQDFFWVTHKRDLQAHKTSLLTDLERLIAVVDLGTKSDTIVFWNMVGPESAAHLEDGVRVGSRIFTSKQNIVEHVATPIINFCLGRAWVSATISRWTNVTTTQKRFVVADAVSHILVDALQNVKVRWDLVGDSIEAALGAILDKNHDDFSSRNKLRMIKFMKVLGRSSLLVDIALALICGRPVDRLTYQLLGHNKTRASLGDLSHPTSSLVASCQDSLWKLAAVGLEENSPWHLVSFLGIDTGTAAFRMSRRRHNLQVSAGVTQVFELRMGASSGPHMLAWLCYDFVSLAVKRQIVHTLFAYPVECLPFMVFCLVKLYPTEAMFLNKAPATLLVWLQSFHSIDFSERAHAQMRTDLASDGCSRSFPTACDRLLVRQFVAAHIDRGGRDVGAAPAAAVAAPICDKGDGDEWSRSRPRVCIGSSPFMEFHSVRMHTKKLLIGQNRKLTSEERTQCEAEVSREWQEILGNEQEHSLWKGLFYANRRPTAVHRAARDSDSANAGDGAASFRGLWSRSTSPHELIPLDALVTFEESSREKTASTRKAEATENASMLIVRPPVPDRKSCVVGGWGSLHGCEDGVRNVCFKHGTSAIRRRLVENLLNLINAWVSSLDSESKQDASQLVLFEGREIGLEGHTQAVLALLVLNFAKPVAQMFVACGFVIPDSPLLPRVMDMPPCPFRVRILDRLGRMCLPGVGSNRRSFHFETSVELADYLVRLQDEWDMHSTNYTMPPGDTVLDMVVSHVQHFVAPLKPKRGQKTSTELLAEFDMGDPFEVAWAAGVGGGDRGGSASDSAGDEDVEIRSAASEDDCLFRDDPPDDFADIIAEGLEEEHEVVAVDDDLPEHDHVDHEHEGSIEHEEKEEDPADLVNRAVGSSDCTSYMGYIQCPIAPWSDLAHIARITYWPNAVPMDKQSMACRCFMHPGCSISRKRGVHSQEQILRWVFSMQPLPPGATSDQKKAAARQHVYEKGAEFLPKVAAPATKAVAVAP